MKRSKDRSFKTISSFRIPSLSAPDFELLNSALQKFKVDQVRFTPGSQLAVSGLNEEQLEAFCEFIKPILEPLPVNGITSIFNCNECSDCKNSSVDTSQLVSRLTELNLPQPMPAKIKVAVARCWRCCTMPRLRDVGFIPTSAKSPNWNISFGGNGGRNPRIGDVIGVNLADNEALDVVQKALTVYQINADPKMRTSSYLRVTTLEIFLKKISDNCQ